MTANGTTASLEQGLADLGRELTEALDQRSASAEILRLIAASPDDLEPMFGTILDHATRLCGARFGIFWLRDEGGATLTAVSLRNVPAALAACLRNGPHQPGEMAVGRAMVTRRAVQAQYVRADASDTPISRATAELGGARTLLAVPMIAKDEVVGVLTIFRQELESFTEAQVNLVTTFADQAAIAIANSRLLRELRARTRELSEAPSSRQRRLKCCRSSPDRRPTSSRCSMSSERRRCASAAPTMC